MNGCLPATIVLPSRIDQDIFVILLYQEGNLIDITHPIEHCESVKE